MINEQVMSQLTTALATILIALLGLLTAYVRKYLAEKTASLKADAKITEMDYFLRKGIDLIDTVVKATNQSLVDGIKAASADGKITEEEAKAIFNTTKDNVMASMTPQIKQSIESVYGDINNFIQQQIEACVRQNRLDGSQIPSLTAPKSEAPVEPAPAVPYEDNQELQAPPY